MTDVRAERPEDIAGVRAVLAAAFAAPDPPPLSSAPPPPVSSAPPPSLSSAPPSLSSAPAVAGVAPVEVGLVDALRGSAAWDPGRSIVAVDAGRVVAYALLSRVVLMTADGDRPALALGPVAVLPDRQRRGLGAAVVRAALARRDDRLVVVLGDPAYYGRFGFVPGAVHGVTGAWSSFGAAWQVLPPAGGTAPGDVRHPAPWHNL